VAFCTDKASLFQNHQKHRRDEPRVEQGPVAMPPTQIGRALRELGITWIAASSGASKRRRTVCQATDAHRQLDAAHDLAASLSHVENRQVTNHYTVRYNGCLYRIARTAVRSGLHGSTVRVEQRLDGTLALRWKETYLPVSLRPAPPPAAEPQLPVRASPTRALPAAP